MRRETVGSVERRKPSQEERFTGFPRSAGGSQPEGRSRRRRGSCPTLHTASIPREGGMERETTQSIERQEPSQDKAFRVFSSVSGWSLFLITRRSQVQILPPLRRKPLAFLHVPRVFSRSGVPGKRLCAVLMANRRCRLAQRTAKLPLVAVLGAHGRTALGRRLRRRDRAYETQHRSAHRISTTGLLGCAGGHGNGYVEALCPSRCD